MGRQKIILPSLYIYCDVRRKRSDGTAPVRLRIRYNGLERIWGLNVYLTQADFKAIRKKYITGNYSDDRKRELKEIKAKVEREETKAANIIEKMPVFNFEEFEHKFLNNQNKNSLFAALEAKINTLINQNRAGYASTYQSTLTVMRLFRGGERKREGRRLFIEGGSDIPLTHVTAEFLNNFEKWLLNKEKSDGGKYSATTVGINIRNIRVIMNEALADGLIQPEAIPFGKNKYRIPSSKKRKLALSIEDIVKIVNADLINGSMFDRCRDYWVFIYFTGGMNVTDMARLKYEYIDGKLIRYVRAKTMYKKLEEPDFISIPITPQANRIIEKWGSKPTLPQRHVFPILKPNMSAVEERKAIMAATKSINTYIKKVAKLVGIEANISTYTARHSFATILKNSGVSVQAISEVLGHSSTKVTQSYLKDFEVDEKLKQFSNLMPKLPE